MLKCLLPLALLGACTADVNMYDDRDLDADADLQMIDADTSVPEAPALDPETAPIVSAAAKIDCTRQRFLHVSNFSYVAPLSECVNGVCPNGCWGVQERTGGFTCDYDASEADYVKTRDYGGNFASYNEIKSLNAHDAAAVANCRAQSGGRPVRTYTVWNGAGWDSEGIAARVHFAELYGPQSELAPHFWDWWGSWRGSLAPIINLSPETGVDFVGVKRQIARECSATRDGWLGVYFYDGGNSGGAGMADWKREAIIRGLNYCTTH